MNYIVELKFVLRNRKSVRSTIFIECSHRTFRKSNHRSLPCKMATAQLFWGVYTDQWNWVVFFIYLFFFVCVRFRSMCNRHASYDSWL